MYSQSDSSYMLYPVDVSALSLKDNAVGSKYYKWSSDSTNCIAVSDLLTKKGMAYIKNYGPGTLATSSLRGGNASHTLVLWNALPIQSPTLGLLDMALLSIDSNDEVTLQEGGNSTMWGSGAISGVIGLNTKLPKKNAISINTSIASFGTYKHKLGLQLVKSKWTMDTKLLYLSAKNDFPINLPMYRITTRQSNAAQTMQHFTHNLSYTPRPNQLLTLHYWYLNAKRKLPPVLTQTSSTADQLDLSHRLSGHYKIVGDAYTINVRMAMFYEKNDFRNDTSLKYSLNRFLAKMADLSYDRKVSNHLFMLGTSWFETSAVTGGYSDKKFENRYAIYFSHKYSLNSLVIQSGLRWESSNTAISPLVPSIGLEYSASKYITLRARVNKNYRFPTLNDLHWKPGGNAFLLPESGWSEEVGLDYKNQKDKDFIQFELTLYNRKTDNWIQWGRLKNDYFFSALNLAEVWSRGMNPRITYQKNYGGLILKASMYYTMTYATHLKSSANPKIETGDQLWYVPKHSIGGGLEINYKRLALAIDHHYFSKTTGINENLLPYDFGNIDLNYWFNIGKSKVICYSSINNYFGKNYFVVERRPSPGRSLQLGFKINIGI